MPHNSGIFGETPMQPPYDNAKLDRLMDEAGVDLILAHTPHNIRYLSGGYYFHFRERIAAIGKLIV